MFQARELGIRAYFAPMLNDDKVRCSLLRKLHESSMADKEAKQISMNSL